MRGKRNHFQKTASRGRITPACAGKTTVKKIYAISHEDHPRVCGENKKHSYRGTNGDGSPPRVRGKLEQFGPDSWVARITPACAGKTEISQKDASVFQDHPRVCGENFPQTREARHAKGSPPRVRGKQSSSSAVASSLRITPACAGKTLRNYQK